MFASCTVCVKWTTINLEVFDLPDEYELEFNNRKLVDHRLIRKGQLLAKEWISEYSFPQGQTRFADDADYEVFAVHPVLDKILFTETGNISVANISILSGGTVLLTAFCCCICCVCCPTCRQCAFNTCSAVTTYIYNKCTSETFRLKTENNKLRKANKQSRKTLEKSIDEYRLVNTALRAIGVDVEDDDDFEMEDSQQNDLNKANDGKLNTLEHMRVKFSSKDGDAKVVLENEHKGEKEKMTNFKHTSTN